MIESLKKEEEIAPFPMDIFPKAVQVYLYLLAESMNCPVDYVAAALLVVISVVIGGATKIRIKPGWNEGAVLYLVLVGEPGSKKTPAVSVILRALKRIQKDNEEQALQEPDESKTIITTNATPEALFELLADNRFLLIYKDELWALFSGMNKYSGGKGDEMEFYLSVWSQTPLAIHRKSKPKRVYVETPFFSLIGGIQDDLLEDVGKLKSNGMRERILSVYPAPIKSKSSDVEVPEELQNQFEDLIISIYNFQKVQEFREFGLSEEAKKASKAWHIEFCESQNEESVPYFMRSFYSKMEAYTFRFALLLEFLHRFSDKKTIDEISEDSINKAILLTNYFISHAAKTFYSYYSSKEDKKIERALMWFSKQPSGYAPLRKVYTNRVAGCKDYNDAYNLLLEMNERGLGYIGETREGQEGGRKSRYFKLNSKYLKSKSNK